MKPAHSSILLAAALLGAAIAFDASAQGTAQPPGPRRPPLPAPGATAPPAGPIAPAPAAGLTLAPGTTSAEIKCAADPEWSYFVYAPKNYRPDRKWPVMFIMSPGGGSAGALRRYIPGAESNGWLLAVSVQSKNNYEGSGKAVWRMVDDVCARLPADTGRLFSSGFSGGSRMATWLALKKKEQTFAGLLVCGAAQDDEKHPRNLVVYGCCGSTCFNRWEMACLFEKPHGKDWRLEYFIGGHAWADAEELELGMTWLNAVTLRDAPVTDPRAAEDRRRLTEALAARVGQLKASDPERAFDWAERHALLAGGPRGAPSPLMAELLRDPKVQQYVKGREELAAFWKKYFATDPAAADKGTLPPKAAKDAAELAEKYKASRLGPLFAQMGQPGVPVPAR